MERRLVISLIATDIIAGHLQQWSRIDIEKPVLKIEFYIERKDRPSYGLIAI